MIRACLSIGTAVLTCLALSGCAATHADRGATVGGLGGAGLGALIGEASGHGVEGALLGGAAGMLTGAVVGDSIDRDNARATAEMNARLSQQNSAAVTTADVVAMTQNGVNEEVIATHIRTSGVAQRLQSADLITLKNQGVSDRVINALQTAPLAGANVAPPASAYAQPVYASPGPVIVEEIHYGPPVYYAPRRHWHPHYCPPPRAGWSVGISSR
jgi:hypothetical protein